MSKLQELIDKLCSDGVEFINLEDILDYEQPNKYIVNSTEYNNNFSVPVLTAGQTFILGYTNETQGIFVASKSDPVIIFDDFTTSFHWIDFNFKVKSSAMKILKPKGDRYVDFRYIYHSMKNINYIPVDHSRQWIGKYSKFKIPLPPLEVQQEIVRILDTFTELTTELTTKLTRELTARKKQYEYYRDGLFESFDKHKIELKDICKFSYGYTDKAKEFGNARFVRITDIDNNGCLNEDNAKYIDLSEECKKYILKKGDLLMARTGATYGKTLYIPNNNPAIYASFLIKLDLNNNIILNKYYWHFSKSILYWEQANRLVSKASQPQFNSNALCKIKVPIPSIEEQEKIVSILDKFDSLYNDISKRIPAEIEARQKQYEYYRDKLLTFKELKKEGV